MEKFPMTAEGHAMLENELMHRQQVERPRIIQQIADARTDDSDLAENAEYHAAQELQEANESRIAELEDKLGEKQVWKIVGEPEADAKQGTISITSPLARALIGNRKGASVEVATPGGTKAYKIQKVEWL